MSRLKIIPWITPLKVKEAKRFLKLSSFILKLSMNFAHSLNDRLYVNKCKINNRYERSWVFATNSNFLIPISVQPDDENLRHFKLRLFDLTEFIVWNIWGLRHWMAKILEFVAKLNSFLPKCTYLAPYLLYPPPGPPRLWYNELLAVIW